MKKKLKKVGYPLVNHRVYYQDATEGVICFHETQERWPLSTEKLVKLVVNWSFI